jgi:hypothetical protein
MTATIGEIITDDMLNVIFDEDIDRPCDADCDNRAEWMIYGTACPGCGLKHTFVCDKAYQLYVDISGHHVHCNNCGTNAWVYKMTYSERITK